MVPATNDTAKIASLFDAQVQHFRHLTPPKLEPEAHEVNFCAYAAAITHANSHGAIEQVTSFP